MEKRGTPRGIFLAADLGIKLLLLVAVLRAFVPLFPGMPRAGLDPSWHFGMNQALAQGLSFGKELIFTFGPYASIYTQEYHPVTDVMMLGGSLYLALSYWLGMVLLMKMSQRWWSLLSCGMFGFIIFYSRDALFFSYPLVVGLASYQMISSQEQSKKSQTFFLLLLLAPLGLFPLVKGSLIILCYGTALLCSLFFLLRQRKLLAVACLGIPLITTPLFWVVSGVPLQDLPSYFFSMRGIIAGYTEAMALNGHSSEIIIYLFIAITLLGIILFQQQLPKLSRFFLVGLFGLCLFIPFKAGFVRHDAHALEAATALLTAALLLPFVIWSRLTRVIFLMAFVGAMIIESHYIPVSIFYKNIGASYASFWQGGIKRMKDPNWPEADFQKALATIKEQASFPLLPGTTDIYSYDQSYLIASGNQWNPRPVFQSYSAYTPELVEKNRAHLLGSQAPDNIIFKVEPIDGRIPSMADGASWPLLLANYEPTQWVHDFLFLKKKPQTSIAPEFTIVRSEKCLLGDVVLLPKEHDLLFAFIEVKPTLLGKLATAFFKPSQLKARFQFQNGVIKEYRLISGMAASGFLIAPLVEDTKDIALLYGESDTLDAKRPLSFSIQPSGGKNVLWKKEYTVTFKTMIAPPAVPHSKVPSDKHPASDGEATNENIKTQ